jgi:hypothetical protein
MDSAVDEGRSVASTHGLESENEKRQRVGNSRKVAGYVGYTETRELIVRGRIDLMDLYGDGIQTLLAGCVHSNRARHLSCPSSTWAMSS